MGIGELISKGLMIAGSALDGKVGNLSDMDDRSAKRLGYMDKQGYWTEKGENRATQADWDRMEDACRARRDSEE